MNELNLNNLGQLRNGKVKLAADEAMRQAIMDCSNRPNIKKARIVTLELKIEPISSDGTFLENVDIQFAAKVKVPPLSLASDILNVDNETATALLPSDHQPALIGRAEKE